MKSSFIHIYKVLYPLALLYELGVYLRNLLFDLGIYRSHTFPLPVICIGNLTVGGTGKTPHTEYLISLLQQKGLQVGVLSRGYKRRSKGFVWGTATTPMEQIGDEPFQMKSKFPSVSLAVDADRCHGIRQMTHPDVHPVIDTILLDDAYQHRYVSAGLNILLTDFHRPIYEDALLPAGRLREPMKGMRRAHIIVVTKCPSSLSALEAENISRRLRPALHQQLFFSTLHYGKLIPWSNYAQSDTEAQSLNSLRGCRRIFLLTGIASPDKLKRDLSAYAPEIDSVTFPDHHHFTEADAALINRRCQQASRDCPIITTEKDATRLTHIPLDEHIRRHLYVLPIEVGFLFNQQTVFNQTIIDYVETHPRNSSLSKRAYTE